MLNGGCSEFAAFVASLSGQLNTTGVHTDGQTKTRQSANFCQWTSVDCRGWLLLPFSESLKHLPKCLIKLMNVYYPVLGLKDVRANDRIMAITVKHLLIASTYICFNSSEILVFINNKECGY